MENDFPNTFLSFLNTIIAIQTQTDKWKSRLFFKPTQDIISALINPESKQSLNLQQQQISIHDIIKYIQQNSSIKQYKSLTQQNYKVIAKYFKFNHSISCSTTQFIKKIKPINNKCIIEIQKLQFSIQQCIIKLFQSILQGYSKIKLNQIQCQRDYEKIISYFKKHLENNCLTRQSLKQFMYEGNIYGRVNFNYLKQYIFGEDEEVIEWKVLFKKTIIDVKDQIKQLSEEQIVSEQQLCDKNVHLIQQKQCTLDEKPIYQTFQKSVRLLQQQSVQQQQLSCHQKSLILQSVSQIKHYSQNVSKKQIQTPNNFANSQIIPPNSANNQNDYNKVLNEINHIQELLNKTKSKYLKNKESLQNQTKQIRMNQVKRQQKIGKFVSRTIQDYSKLKIQTQLKKCQNQANQEKKTFIDNYENQVRQNIISPKNTQLRGYIPLHSIIKEKKIEPQSQQRMIQSHVKPFMPKQLRKNIIQQTLRSDKSKNTEILISKKQNNYELVQKKVAPSQSDQQKRQAGKIKRRSVSKDKQKVQPTQSLFSQTYTPKNNKYDEYESVLKQIKRQQLKYTKLVQQGQKYLQEKQMKKRLNLDNNQYSKPYKRYYCPLNSTFESQESLIKQKRVDLTLHSTYSASKNKFNDIMKQIEQNTLSRSRISSKKREEIVHKATSEAKLRIQQIQKRALGRLAKLDSQSDQIQSKLKRNQNYSTCISKNANIDKKVTKEQQNSDNKKVQITKPKAPTILQSKNRFFMMNELMNQRPNNLKLSSKTSSNIRKV